MLQKLIIKNYAIIDNVILEPDAHLNIVTGETGAGKSIILGALSLILGERADTSVLINKDEKCIVEAHFEVAENESFQDALKEDDLDDEKICIIRREIGSNGKSRAFINDTPVTLGILNKLTTLLVDLHQQFDQMDIENDHFQMDVLDAIAHNGPLRKQYSTAFQQYRKHAQQLAEKKTQLAQWQKESDYKQFLLDELVQLDFKENEIEDADLQLKQMSHSERIISVLQAGRYILEEGEQPMINELKRINQQLHGITDVMPGITPLQARLSSAYAELKDIASEMELLEQSVSLDAELMQQLQERLDIGYKMLKKHAVSVTNELLSLQSNLQEELKSTLDLTDTIEQLTREKEEQYKSLMELAEKLSVQRKIVAPQISGKINELLSAVGMPNARFEISLKKSNEPGTMGTDIVAFLLDANKSGQFLPVHKAASGGEMSRIMLCIKSLTAKAMHLPTLIFDEVDTGISGEAARQVAVLLRDLANYHQVICITHQPQVAAKGTKHFYVFKDIDNNQRITTKLRILKQDERVLAIAQMIGGEKPSEAAMQNAKELVTT